eukprot:scaffold31667_cov107-Isochrysis_galbana.AAC.4
MCGWMCTEHGDYLVFFLILIYYLLRTTWLVVVSAQALSRALLCQGPAEYSPRCPLWGQQGSLAGQPYGYSHIDYLATPLFSFTFTFTFTAHGARGALIRAVGSCGCPLPCVLRIVV